MDSFLYKIFLGEIQNQCQNAIIAYDELIQALNLEDTKKVWYSLQGFLIACANVSKILWPSQGDPKRGQELVQNISVVNTIFSDKDARNYFEHFDEHIDDWYKKDPLHIFIDNCYGPTNMFGAGLKPMRFFDTDKFSFKYGNDEMPINPMLDSIRELLDKVNIIIGNH